MPVKDLLSDALDRLEALYERGEAVTGVPTGFHDLDERLAGLQANNLIVVGARPAMGKTSFALGILAHAAMKANVPTLLFSLEMGREEITQRAAALRSAGRQFEAALRPLRRLRLAEASPTRSVGSPKRRSSSTTAPTSP